MTVVWRHILRVVGHKTQNLNNIYVAEINASDIFN